ncbi:MAG: hypothetical protein Q7S93_04960 [Phenylobacterium sp.]|uniref:hypothetical protein n=1 Tax=Phenylobacterium sp. TaxID=1871053 RepID=UPI00271D75F9|nr:hypothetical protein [Phenylobacterium sp.]MDO8409391.1 hypothetical protein [Phenylobacterium sp.]
MSPVLTLDFEASCLPQHGRSYPIEVGVAGSGGMVWSWLIRPEPAWRDWTWTDEAEHLHGLTYDQLVRDGVPAREVLGELTAVVGDQLLFADSYLDAGWMRVLETAAGTPPLLRVYHIDALIDRLKVSDETVSRIVYDLARLPFRRHRAGEDARWLQALAARLVAAVQVEPIAPKAISLFEAA